MAAYPSASRIHNGHANAVVFVGLQPFAVGGDFNAHVCAEGGERQGCGCEAFVAAALLNGRDDEGLEHSGRIPRVGKFHGHGEVPGGGQLLIVQGIFCRCEIAGRTGEAVAVEALEGGAGFLQRHAGACRAVPRNAAGQPAGAGPDGHGLASLEHFFIVQAGGNLEAVGLDGLNVQRLVEAAGANLQVCVPIAGRVIGLGGNVKGEEAVRALADEFCVELALGGVHFKGGGVPVRQALSLILDDGRHVQGVARTPYSALAIDEGFEAFLQHLSPNVESAQGALCGQFEVGGAATCAAYHGKGFMAHFHLCKAVAARFCRADSLQLIVVCLDAHPA